MPWIEIFRLSVESLSASKFRTALTMLGMIIGVFAVVVLVSLGNGAKLYVTSEFEGLGTNFIVIQPGKTDKKTGFGPPVGAAQRKMTLQDVVALEKRSFNLEAVTGLVMGTTSVRFDDSIVNVNVFGCNENFIKIFNLKLTQGDFFTREEDDFGRRVVVLGHEVAGDLFGEESPLGRQVRINQREFRVIGVFDKSGQTLGFNIDQFVFVPTTAALRAFNEDKLFGIRAKARSKSNLDDAVAEVKEILTERRDGEEDFTIVTQSQIMQSMDTILGMLTYVLAGIACISMLVGGIGIMNIMLVSVTERIPEIGIRRAVGARQGDIVRQFLSESVMLSTIAGVIGLGGAVLVSVTMRLFFPSFDLTPPVWVLPPAFLLSILTGVVFGVWPAVKASRIEALEALRHE